MAFDLDKRLVIGVSSRALFDLTKENEIFEREGVNAYCAYQLEHENDILKPGPGFALVKALLDINKMPGQEGRVEVIIMSRNSPDTSLRVFNTIKEYGLDISRAVLASGASLAPYLTAFKTDLFCLPMRMMSRELLIPVSQPVLFAVMASIHMTVRARFHRSESHLMGMQFCFPMNLKKYSRVKVWKHFRKMRRKTQRILSQQDLLQNFLRPFPIFKKSSVRIRYRFAPLS